MLDFITNDTVFYISAPANAATGGPELLHQLAFKLKSAGRHVFMYYTPNDLEDPVHDNYKDYGIEFVREVQDTPNNVLIVPEIQTALLDRFTKAKKIIWWLSVDNYFRNLPGVKGKLNRILVNQFGVQNYLFFNRNVEKVDCHFVQSKYAETFLKKRNITNIEFLADYLHKNFLNESYRVEEKSNIVVYNPKKGIRFTRKLMNNARHVKFVPIENMSRNEVVELLKVAKIYIDFGFHPGKDRIPREAGFLGCCIITNKKGSAYFHEDVPIPEDYKFHESELSAIVNKIDSCISDFELNLERFESYRSLIEDQESEFDDQVENIFK